MKNLRIKWLKFFHYKKFILQKCFDFHHFLFIFPFHIEMSKLSHRFLTNHMYINIYNVVYQYLLPKA